MAEVPVRCCYENKGALILAAIVLDVQSGPKSNFFLPFMGAVTRLGKSSRVGNDNYQSQFATRSHVRRASLDAVSEPSEADPALYRKRPVAPRAMHGGTISRSPPTREDKC